MPIAEIDYLNLSANTCSDIYVAYAYDISESVSERQRDRERENEKIIWCDEQLE